MCGAPVADLDRDHRLPCVLSEAHRAREQGRGLTDQGTARLASLGSRRRQPCGIFFALSEVFLMPGHVLFKKATASAHAGAPLDLNERPSSAFFGRCSSGRVRHRLRRLQHTTSSANQKVLLKISTISWQAFGLKRAAPGCPRMDLALYSEVSTSTRRGRTGSRLGCVLLASLSWHQFTSKQATPPDLSPDKLAGGAEPRLPPGGAMSEEPHSILVGRCAASPSDDPRYVAQWRRP